MQRPLISLLLFLLIAADTTFVIRSYTWSGGTNNSTTTVIPRAISKHVLGLKVPDVEFFYPWSCMLVRETDHYRNLGAETQSADELTKLLVTRPADVVEVRRTRFIGRRGWWAPTEIIAEHRLRIKRMSDGTVPPDEQAVRDAYAKTMFAKRDPDWPRLATADVLDHRIIWFGHAHNTAALLLLILFVVSLGWMPRLWGEGRRRRFLARELCPACKYDLSGTTIIAAQKTCPECGRTWPHTPANDKSATP